MDAGMTSQLPVWAGILVMFGTAGFVIWLAFQLAKIGGYIGDLMALGGALVQARKINKYINKP